MPTIIIQDDSPIVVQNNTTINAVVNQNNALTANVSVPGPRGPQGPAGSGSLPTLVFPAAVALGGHRAVYLDENGRFAYASASTLDKVPVGLTQGAAAQFDPATVQTFGPITNSGWTWDVSDGGDVFLGENGQLTQSPPEAYALLRMGSALTATQIQIDIDQAYYPES